MKIEDLTVNGVRLGGAETKDEQETGRSSCLRASALR